MSDQDTARFSISSLPVELLAMIFREMMSSTRNVSFEDILEPFDTTLRSVCRLWLRLIDSMPELWTRLVLERPVKDFHRLRTVLKQSEGAFLDLTIKLQSMSEEILYALLPEFPRVRLLEIECAATGVPQPDGMPDDTWLEKTTTLKDWMRILIWTPAPVLQVVIFYSFDNLTDYMFAGETPVGLRCVSLTNCLRASSIPSIFRSTELTTLDIDACIIWETLDGFLEVLCAVPKLRHLIWDTEQHNSAPHLQHPNNYAPKSVRLPNLCYMNLCLPMDTFALLLPLLDFPKTTELTIEGRFDNEVDMDSDEDETFTPIEAIQSALEPHFKSLFPDNAQGYTHMHFSQHDRLSCTEGFSVRMYIEGPLAGPVPDFTFGVSWDYDRHKEYTEIVARLFGWHGIAANARHVTAEHMQNGFLDDAHQWARLLGQLPNISVLDVWGDCATAVFGALQLNAVPLPTFVPALETVVVRNTDAGAGKLIIETLDRRVGACLPKLKLKLSNCEIEAPVLRSIMRHQGVEQAHWDGKKWRAISAPLYL